MSPRVIPADGTRAPVRARGYRPALGIVLIAVTAFLPLGVALVAVEPGLRVFMAALGLLILGAIPLAVSWTGALVEGRIRVDADAAGLRFVPPRGFAIVPFVVAVAGLLVAGLPVVLAASGLPATVGNGITRFSPFLLALACLVWLGYQVWGWREPAGLTLTPAGLRGVRGGAHVDIAWDDLARVDLVDVRGARVALYSRSGAATVIVPQHTGSDPNLVAAIIAHFLAHPEDRAALTDARTATAVVEAAVAASP